MIYAIYNNDQSPMVEIQDEASNKMIHSAVQSGINETGGIILGHYNKELTTAIITDVANPSNDSKFGKYWFCRGTNGLQRILNTLWKSNTYYLGEWHVHPNTTPMPSQTDVNQMIKIANNKNYKCPEPLLIIVGFKSSKPILAVFVVLNGNKLIELKSAE